VERRLLGDRRSPVQEKVDEVVEVNLFKLLFRKRLPQILGAYLAGGWIALEAALAWEGRAGPEWVVPVVAASLPFGFLATSIFGWFHGERGRQTMPAVEKWMLGTLMVGWIVAVAWVWIQW
jgi:hypothetical protein